MLKSATVRGALLIAAVLGLLAILKFKAAQPAVIKDTKGVEIAAAKEVLKVGFLPVT